MCRYQNQSRTYGFVLILQIPKWDGKSVKCRYNSWTPLSKSMRRFSRNPVCSTNFMELRPTVYSLVLGYKLMYVRTDLVLTYDISKDLVGSNL
jgi:hypothetical protein